MKHRGRIRITLVCALLAGAVALAGCTKVPLSGRSQLNLIPPSEMLATSQLQYADFLKANPPSQDQVGTER